MPKTSKSAWTAAERRAATLFGCKRQPCSGSSGRSDLTRSDSTHERLFIEAKLRASSATRTLHDATRELARRESKTPVLCLFDKSRPGFLVAVHANDIEDVLVEYIAANASDELEERIKEAFARGRDNAPSATDVERSAGAGE